LLAQIERLSGQIQRLEAWSDKHRYAHIQALRESVQLAQAHRKSLLLFVHERLQTADFTDRQQRMARGLVRGLMAHLAAINDPQVQALVDLYVSDEDEQEVVEEQAEAAQRLRDRDERVAIIDVDVHHGNGTQGIFYERDDVLTVSIHADPDHYYPFFWGHAHEHGAGKGQGFNLNLPLPLGSADAPWLEAGDRALARIRDFQPTALVVALGLDASESDPLQGLKVTGAGFHAMAEKIARLGLPTVLVQEGGYLGDDLGRNLVQFLAGFEKGRGA